MLKLGFILAIICAVAGAALAQTHAVTAKVIAAREAKDFQDMLRSVLPEAVEFTAETMGETTFHVGQGKSGPVGVVFTAAETGFSGPVTVLMAVTPSGKVIAVRVVGHSETPGIGTKATDAPAFAAQFAGKSGADKLAVGQDIAGVTGATVSSRAISAAVKQGLKTFGELYLGQAPSGIDLAKVPDGTYEGEGQGYNGKIRVAVTVAGKRITEVKVLAHTESVGLSDPAFAKVPGLIVSKQSYDVDAASGATWTSKGIMDAVQEALDKAAGN
ncbi:MAG: FMN-binding protein [Bacillota bacterium]